MFLYLNLCTKSDPIIVRSFLLVSIIPCFINVNDILSSHNGLVLHFIDFVYFKLILSDWVVLVLFLVLTFIVVLQNVFHSVNFVFFFIILLLRYVHLLWTIPMYLKGYVTVIIGYLIPTLIAAILQIMLLILFLYH
jgi:hypothetical protein